MNHTSKSQKLGDNQPACRRRITTTKLPGSTLGAELKRATGCPHQRKKKKHQDHVLPGQYNQKNGSKPPQNGPKEKSGFKATFPRGKDFTHGELNMSSHL